MYLAENACIWLVVLFYHITVGDSVGMFLLGLVCLLVGVLVVVVVIAVGVITSLKMVAEGIVVGVYP